VELSLNVELRGEDRWGFEEKFGYLWNFC
jgi:hypothetical protein